MATMHLLREIHNICTWEHDQGEKWDVKQFAKLHFDLRGEERLKIWDQEIFTIYVNKVLVNVECLESMGDLAGSWAF